MWCWQKKLRNNLSKAFILSTVYSFILTGDMFSYWRSEVLLLWYLGRIWDMPQRAEPLICSRFFLTLPHPGLRSSELRSPWNLSVPKWGVWWTIVPGCSGGSRVFLNWSPMMRRNVSLSDGSTCDCCGNYKRSPSPAQSGQLGQSFSWFSTSWKVENLSAGIIETEIVFVI